MADFLINVIVDPNRAVRGARRTENALRRVDRQANRTQQLLNRAFLLAGAFAGLRVLANFEQAMSSVRAISGATAEQFEALSDRARELGATTRFTATDAAEGMLFLSRAGFSVNESLEAVGGTLTLAQAGALSLGRAADIASNVLQGFRLETDRTQDLVDVLAFTANRANTSVQQLGDAMSFVAPVAAGVGVSVRETAAAIAALSDAGIQGERAGTGLRRVIAGLESPTGPAAKVIKSLGINLEEVRVSSVGLTTALARLSDAGVTTGQALEIFGQRGGPAFEVLTSSIPKVREMNAALGETEGFAAGVAEVMDDNLNGAMLAARSALEAVILALGDAFLAEALQIAFEGLATALRFTADNVEILIGLLSALALRTIPAAIAAAGRLALTIGAMLGPIGLIGAALGLAGGAAVAFADDIKLSEDGLLTLSTVSQAVFEELRTLAPEALAAVQGAFQDLTSNLQEAFGPAIAGVLTSFAELLPSFDEVLSGARTFVNRFIGTFVGLARAQGEILRGIGRLFSETFEQLFGLAIPDLLEGVVGFVGEAVSFIRRQFVNLLDVVGAGVGHVKNLIDDTDFSLPDFVLPDSIREIGVNAKDAFLSGFDTDYVGAAAAILEEPYRRIIERARELGREQAEAAAAGAADAGGGETESPARPALEPITVETEDPAFRQLREQLAQEGELLRLNSAEREVRMELLRAEEELGRELSGIERVQIEQLFRENQALGNQAEILEQILGPQQRLKEGQEALNALMDRGLISTGQYTQALRELRLAALETDNTISGGLERAFLRIQDQVGTVGSQVEGFLVGAFNSASDALTEFATTGKLEFRDFVSSLLSDLARLLSQRMLMQLIQSFGPGAGGAGALQPINVSAQRLPVPGFQHGGEFQIGGQGGPDSQLVAFMGSPGENVAVTPQGQSRDRGEQPAPNVNVPVQVVNVQDPSEIPRAMQSAQGEEVILNTIRRNPEFLRQFTR